MNQLVHKTLHLDSGVPQARIAELMVEIFTALGFSKIQRSGDEIIVRRGSKAGNGWVNDPLKWKSDIAIDLRRGGKGTVMQADFQIDTTNQMVSAIEAAVWDSMVELVEEVALSGSLEALKDFQLQRRKATEASRWVFAGLVLGMVVTFPLSIWLSTWLNFQFVGLIVVLAGAFLGFRIARKLTRSDSPGDRKS